MKIIMSGMDYKIADISLREQLSFTPFRVKELNSDICKMDGVNGCVIISTCNRTEIYISCSDNLVPAELLCRGNHTNYEKFKQAFKTLEGEDVVAHLFEVACGMKSQILGEDQIVTQVKTALQIARDAKSTSSELDTLFRTAVTAGKECKAKVRVKAVPLSVSYQAVEDIKKHLGDIQGKNAVVIGNGEMGRLASDILYKNGCNVTVTLRSYRHGHTIVPIGCNAIKYEDRMDIIDGCDFVISATTSPHFTLTKEQIEGCNNPPKLVVDLALPRDIDPEISQVFDIKCINMDDISFKNDGNKEELNRIYDIIEKHKQYFSQWLSYKKSLPIISDIKTLATDRVLYSRELDDVTDINDAIKLSVEKTVEMILGGMKETLTPEVLEQCRDKILEKMPRQARIGRR